MISKRKVYLLVFFLVIFTFITMSKISAQEINRTPEFYLNSIFYLAFQDKSFITSFDKQKESKIPKKTKKISANSQSGTSTSEIWGPMIDNFSQGSTDTWHAVADSNGVVSATVYSGDTTVTATLTGSVGSDSITISSGAHGAVSLSGLSSGEVVSLNVTNTGEGYHYRPKFTGVSNVYITEDSNSPNDFAGDSSDVELGFDARWSSLPSHFSNTTWYYNITGSDTSFVWQIKSGWPGGAGIQTIQLFDPGGIQQNTLGPLTGSSTFNSSFNVSNPAAGWWRVKVSVSTPIEPWAQHYLIHSSTGVHYLNAGSIMAVSEQNKDNTAGQPDNENVPTGEPVNSINGNMYIIKTDLSTPAPGIPFEFVRAYNSMYETDSPLGIGSTHNFNIIITPPQDDTSSAIITDEDGGEITFYQTSPNVFEAMSGEYSRLTKGGSSFVWEKKDKTTYNFDSNGKLQTIQDRNSNTISLSYDSQGRLSTITDTASRNYSLTYDANDHITSIADSTGRTATYQYDSNDNLTKVTDPAGIVTEYEYNDSNDPYNITKQTEDNKFIFTYSYDTQDRCTAASGPSGEFGYSFDYKPNEGKTVITDTRGNVTTKHYNSDYMITQIDYPDGSSESFTWDSSLNKTSETLQDGSKWQYQYDGNGNITKITDPLGNYKVMVYDSNDNLTSLNDELGRVTTYTTDSNGNLTKTTYPDGTYITFTYNAIGQPLTVTDPMNKTTTYTYDSSGNLASTTDPEGNAGAYVYNSLGQRTSATDARGKVTQYQYDAMNRVTKVTDALGGQINNTHEIAGLGSLKDQNNNTTTFQYDSLNQLTTITDPLGKTKQLGYDSMKNQTSRTDFNGSATAYTYNTMDRLTAITYPDSSQATFAYDTVGRLTRTTNYTSTSTYAYDTMGRITSYTNAQELSVNYGYDAVGNLTSLTYPGSKIVTYTYDSQNRLTKVSDWLGRETLYSYDQRGLLTKATLPNSTTAQYEYDNAGRITTLKNLKSDGSVIATYSYTLDKNGNIVSETVNQPLSPVIQSQAVNYTYGSDNRLLSDGDTSFTYDQNGNLIAKGGTTYQYDYENRLKKVATSQGAWEYGYDGQGNRVEVINSGNTRRFLLDPTGMTRALAEYDGDGNLVANYIYGLGLVYKVDASGNAYYYHYDFTGNTVAMTDADENIVNKYAYTPFGTVANSEESVSNPFRYVGKYGVMDDNNDLLYMRARYYSPGIGRFITKDPIGFAGGVNLYAYVENNPVNFNDVTGLCSDTPNWYDVRGVKQLFVDNIAKSGHWVLAGIVGALFDLSPPMSAQDFGEALGSGDYGKALISLISITAPASPLRYIKYEAQLVNKYNVVMAKGWEKMPNKSRLLHWLVGSAAQIGSSQNKR